MLKKFFIIVSTVAIGLLALTLATGCGEDEPQADLPGPEQMGLPSTSSENDDLNKKIEELKKKEMTVEIIEDGKSLDKWSQDGKGSWRIDDADLPTSYTIYNAEKNKMWDVDSNVATEVDPSLSQAYEMGSPLLLLSAYSSFAYIPRTGGSDDEWEWNVTGMGSLKIEFKGPDGLISRIISDGEGTGRTEIEFKYTNLGDVPASMFELPSDVEVQTFDGGGITGTSTSVSPSGGGSSNGSSDGSGGLYQE